MPLDSGPLANDNLHGTGPRLWRSTCQLADAPPPRSPPSPPPPPFTPHLLPPRPVALQAQLVRTALPAELMNRRNFYRKDRSEASCLVSVAGEDWNPVDAPHQVPCCAVPPRTRGTPCLSRFDCLGNDRSFGGA